MHIRACRGLRSVNYFLPTDFRAVYTIIKLIRDLRFVSFLKRYFFHSLLAAVELSLCAYRVSATNTTVKGPRFSQTYRGLVSRMDLVIIKLSRDSVFFIVSVIFFFFFSVQPHVLIKIPRSAIISNDEMYNVDRM